MRPGVNVSSNYWNQTFTIIPFWEKVNQSDDCLNASSGLSSNFSILQITLSKCHTCPIGSKVNIQFVVNEVDNDYFVVERSEDGRNFEAIGRIESKGDGEHQYSFEDLSISKSGTYYYAIKDVSNAGVTGKPSDVKAISIDANLLSNQVLLLNNPCFSNGSFSISNLSLGDVVSIYSLDGKLLRQFILDDASAFFHNKVEFPAPQFPGLFVLTVSRLDYSISFKLAVF